jgi:hypothetical protein
MICEGLVSKYGFIPKFPPFFGLFATLISEGLHFIDSVRLD